MLKTILGTLLRGVHAGEKHLAWNNEHIAAAPDIITVTSNDFAPGAAIPIKFAGTGVGANVSPSLKWAGVPAETVELVLVIEDPDAPMPRPFVHLVGYGIPPTCTGFAAATLGADCDGKGITFGTDTLGRRGYNGPRAPKGHGPHRYLFEVFALNKALKFSKSPGIKDLVQAMTQQGSVIARGKLEGVFEQK